MNAPYARGSTAVVTQVLHVSLAPFAVKLMEMYRMDRFAKDNVKLSRNDVLAAALVEYLQARGYRR